LILGPLPGFHVPGLDLGLGGSGNGEGVGFGLLGSGSEGRGGLKLSLEAERVLLLRALRQLQRERGRLEAILLWYVLVSWAAVVKARAP
jgi:hypothetical protein